MASLPLLLARLDSDERVIAAHGGITVGGFAPSRAGCACAPGGGVTGHASDIMPVVYQRPRSLFDSSAGAFFDE